MTRESDRKREDAADEKAEINPAARRDRPGKTPPEPDPEERTDGEVPPVQDEPLDPLGPGGIGG